MNHRIAFLVLSCDRYYDMLSPFVELFERFWPDCPYKKYVATNLKPFTERGFRPILMGDDLSWSKGLKIALSELEKDYDYVFVALEDLFLCEKVNTQIVNRIVDEFISYEGNYLRLYEHFKPVYRVSKDLGILEKGIPYRQNCVYAMWKISVLKNLLKDDESAWEFEKKGVVRGYAYDGFYTVYKSQFNILNTLIKGKWVPYDYRKARKMLPGFKSSRPQMSKVEELKLDTKRFLFKLFFRTVPRKYQMYFFK